MHNSDPNREAGQRHRQSVKQYAMQFSQVSASALPSQALNKVWWFTSGLWVSFVSSAAPVLPHAMNASVIGILRAI